VARFRFDALSRLAWILTGLLGAAWIGFEDRGLAAVTPLAWMISISALLTARARRSRREPILRPADLRWWLLAGAAAGALAGPIEALLILLKVGLHAHPVPDFATADVVAVLGRIPIWTAAGALLGASAALIERAAGE